ncbi:MAG: outer membrane beta-barrel protein [Candidatus Sericytochromatia bacterium]
MAATQMKSIKFFLLPLIILATQVSTAFAGDNKVDIRLEGDIGGQYNSNLAQIKNFPGDFINAYTMTGTLRYLAPTQTQILARVQGQYNKFLVRNDFDVANFAGSITLSQWFFNSLNVYAGVQPMQLVSLSSNRRPLDMLYLGGLTYYYPFADDIAYVGYQADRLQASAKDFNSLNHTAFLGLRHPLNENFILNLGARARLRDLDTATDDTRYTGSVSAQYLVNDWLTIQVSSDYTQVNSTAIDRNIGVYNMGVNLIGGYNQSFNF